MNNTVMNNPHIGPGPPALSGLPPDAATWVSEVLQRTEVASPDEVVGVRLMRDAPKRLAFVHLSPGKPSPGKPSSDKEIVLKQYRDREGVQTNQTLQTLADAGLAAPGRFRVTRPLGWDDGHLTQVAERAPGLDWGTWFDVEPDRLRGASAAVAEWMIALQQLTRQRLSAPLRDQSQHRSPARLMRESGELADLFPDHAPAVFVAAEQAVDVLSSEPESLVASHGDLHLDEVFVTEDPQPVVTVVDLDSAGLRRPSADIGFALAMLLVSSRLRTGSFVPGATAGLSFWTRWAPTGSDRAAVPSQMVRSLLMSLHLELVAYGKDRAELLPIWLDLSTTALSSGVEAALARASQLG